jgi:integrase
VRARVPSYRLHKVSGQAVVTLRGRDHYLGSHGSEASRQLYDRLLAEWLVERNKPAESPKQVAAIGVVELVAAYLDFAQGYYRQGGQPTSEYVAVRDALKPVVELYGGVQVSEFGPLALKACRERMVQRGLARRHVNQRVNRIRRCFRWGVENELVAPTVLEGLRSVTALKKGRTPAPETLPVQPVLREHVEAVLPHVAKQVACMIQLQLLTGMRPGEVVQMRPGDIDRSGPVWVYRPIHHKTDYRGIDRLIYLGPAAQELLAPWLSRSPETFCFSPREAEQARHLARRAARRSKVTPSQAARRPRVKPRRAKRDWYDRDSYRRAIEYGIRRAGCPHWHPHQLRHTRATEIRAKFGLDMAQVILGHQTCEVSQVYAQADHQRAVQLMASIG